MMIMFVISGQALMNARRSDPMTSAHMERRRIMAIKKYKVDIDAVISELKDIIINSTDGDISFLALAVLILFEQLRGIEE